MDLFGDKVGDGIMVVALLLVMLDECVCESGWVSLFQQVVVRCLGVFGVGFVS